MATLAGRRPNVPIVWPALAFGILFGSIFLGVGLLIRSSTTPYEDGVTVEGVVIDVAVERDSDGDRSFRSVVEFQDPETGQFFTTVGSVGSSSSPTIGDTRTVSYLADSPSEARIIEHQWFPWIFIAIGAVVLGLVVFSLLRVGLRLLLAFFGAASGTQQSTPTLEVDEITPMDAGSRPADSVYRPFGGEDDSVQDGPITGGPLE